jgi:hypothetical protein
MPQPGRGRRGSAGGKGIRAATEQRPRVPRASSGRPLRPPSAPSAARSAPQRKADVSGGGGGGELLAAAALPESVSAVDGSAVRPSGCCRPTATWRLLCLQGRHERALLPSNHVQPRAQHPPDPLHLSLPPSLSPPSLHPSRHSWRACWLPCRPAWRRWAARASASCCCWPRRSGARRRGCGGGGRGRGRRCVGSPAEHSTTLQRGSQRARHSPRRPALRGAPPRACLRSAHPGSPAPAYAAPAPCLCARSYLDRLEARLQRQAGAEGKLLKAGEEALARQREARASLAALAPRVAALVRRGCSVWV